MKKKLPLFLIYVVEIAFLLVFLIPDWRDGFAMKISWLVDLWENLRRGLQSSIDFFQVRSLMESWSSISQNAVALLAWNILFFIVYCLVVGVFSLIAKKRRKRKMRRQKVDEYALSEEEKAKFEWKLYSKRFSWKGFHSFLIPLAVIACFLMTRFDRVICDTFQSNQKGFLSIYSTVFRPLLESLSYKSDIAWFENIFKNYIGLMNDLSKNVSNTWIEFVILGVGVVLLLLLWLGIVWIFTRMFRTHAAKKRAKKAKRLYIQKMESLEYRARKNAGDRISSKSSEILGEEDVYFDQDTSIHAIADITTDFAYAKNSIDTREASYLDDIGTGVTDLGVAQKESESSETPIAEREIVFVGEEDIDIVLEDEPVLETIVEEDIEENEIDDDIFYERYEPEQIDTSFLDESYVQEQVETIHEGQQPIEKETPPVIATYEERVEQKPIVENKVQHKLPDKPIEPTVLQTQPIEEKKPIEEEKSIPTPMEVKEKSIGEVPVHVEEKKAMKPVLPIRPVTPKHEFAHLKNYEAISNEEIGAQEAFEKSILTIAPKVKPVLAPKAPTQKPITPIPVVRKPIENEKERFKNIKEKTLSFEEKKDE